MKRILSITLMLIFYIMGKGNVEQPDFAYPQTTSEEAQKALSQAIADGDAADAINALIVYTISENMVDGANAPKSIEKIQSTAAMFEGDALEGIFDLLLSQLYLEIYQSDSWKYDRRQLPLTPLPDDITEWSGDQYKAKITEYADKSITEANIQNLRQLPIGKYPQIVAADSLTTTYYPTMADFAYSKAADIYTQIYQRQPYAPDTEGPLPIYRRAAAQAVDTASEIQWQTQVDMAANTGYENKSKAYTALAATYDKYKDTALSGLILDRMWAYYSRQDESQYLQMLREYVARYPQEEFAKHNFKDNYIKQLLKKTLTLQYPHYCALNGELEVVVTDTKATAYTVKAYYIGELAKSYDEQRKQFAQAEKRGKPEVQKRVTNEGGELFTRVDTVRLRLTRPGYYMITAQIDGLENSDTERSITDCTYCTAVLPMIVQQNDNSAVIMVTDPATGAPISKAQVKVTTRKGTLISTANTDKDGIANIKIAKDNTSNISITHGGYQYKFPSMQIYNYGGTSRSKPLTTTQILTDRSLYHPGETVAVLGIVSQSGLSTDGTEKGGKPNGRLLEGAKIEITLIDVNGQKVATDTLITDQYGRCTTEFVLPTDGLTGTYSIRARAQGDGAPTTWANIMVSDYRMPDFELRLTSAENDTPTPGDVTLSGEAITYSGMPISGTTVDINVKSSPLWYWGSTNSLPTIYSVKVTTDSDGKFTAVVPDSVMKATGSISYIATADATSASGSAASATIRYAIAKKYNISASLPNSNIDGAKPLALDVEVTDAKGQKCQMPLAWALLAEKDTRDARPMYEEYSPYYGEIEVEDDTDTFDIAKAMARGEYTGTIDLSKVTPGRYVLYIYADDREAANTLSLNITVYNEKSGKVPQGETLWVETNEITVNAGAKARLLIATGGNPTHLYTVLSYRGKAEYVDLGRYDYGYHWIEVDIPQGAENAQLSLCCVRDTRTYNQQVALKVNKDAGLKIQGETFRDRLTPGTEETWNIKVTRADGSDIEAAVALDMYNKALDAIYPHSFGVRFYTGSAFTPIRMITAPTDYTRSVCNEIITTTSEMAWLQAPNFYTYGYDLYSGPTIMYAMGTMMKARSAGTAPMVKEEAVYSVADMADSMDNAIVTGAALTEDAAEEESKDIGGEGGQEQNTPADFEYRDAEVPMAIWAPMLTTDAQGNLRYTFTVPNANTTWLLYATAWTQDLQTGNMMRQFIASKPVMVQPNVPRFLRADDTAEILTTVMNRTDSIGHITTVVEIFNPVTQEVISARTFVNDIEAMGHTTVACTVTADANMSAIGYRVRSSNGDFADGEQDVIRILPNEQQVIETTPFYLNPGDKEYRTKLANQKNARITLTYSENPAWTIVSALPGLRTQVNEYANSAAAALYSAAISRGIAKSNPEIERVITIWRSNPTDSALVSMLEKNQDLKIALLNATPWVQAAQSDNDRMANLALIFDNREIDKSIANAIEILQKLQNADGGWSWGKWCETSSVWVTSNVLGMLGDLRTLGWQPKNKSLESMTTKAVKYYDAEVEKTDLLYTLIRPMYAHISVSDNGKKVIAATIADVKKHWKSYTDPAYKAMAAMAMWRNGEKALAQEMMRSVSQFGVYTKDQGLKFPSVNALYDYAILLEAYATIEPDGKEVDGLRQQLIVRKQATDWGTAVVTTEVVRSILMSGSKWTVDAQGAEIKAGDTIIKADNEIETATGNIRADLSQYGGKTLTITTPSTGPSYGAVYTQYIGKMTDIKASGCDDLDIEKQMYVRRGSTWEQWQAGTALQVGDRVKVQLTIHSKRNLQYVSIIDQRPAAFTPVDQLPGWVWSEGVGFYRENGDSDTSLHVVYMRPGTYLLTYEMHVNTAGTYSSGVASIQSQCAPEISAHSSGTEIKIDGLGDL